MDIRHSIQTGGIEAAMEKVNDLDPEVFIIRLFMWMLVSIPWHSLTLHITAYQRSSTRTLDSTFTCSNNA
jgi:hypothetical protein